MVLLVGKGDGSFRAAIRYGAGSPYSMAAAVGDCNGDGFPDVAVTGVTILLNDGKWGP